MKPLCAVLLLGIVGCVDQSGEIGTAGDPGTSSGSEAAPAEVKRGDWDEARSHGAEPCGDASIASCGAATRGACDVLDMPWGDACMPVFDWGVRPDGKVEFGSSERLFTIDDLATTPLSETERVEAEELASVIVESAASGEEPMSATEGEPGLIGINHSGNCAIGRALCTTTCYGSCVNTYAVYRYHYDSYTSGYHVHVFDRYDNYGGTCYRTPYYSGTSAMICGYL